jgi:hypothetical protein
VGLFSEGRFRRARRLAKGVKYSTARSHNLAVGAPVLSTADCYFDAFYSAIIERGG